ncbi:hypothetical protein TNIN_351891 [Trichonephila inaurata madagascariensis]|uniref:Uncharacterized protein n=1 Tax=Trichonephila inaurata madagascariensis TaxID=2747483 RepID=A0A8X7CKV2_9ARAC|nr:hypothetical protein TNIN_351891 [Trichonephila inaurata madagascariensis]
MFNVILAFTGFTLVLSVAVLMKNAVLSTSVMISIFANTLHRYILIKKLKRLEKIANILGKATKSGNKSDGVFWDKNRCNYELILHTYSAIKSTVNGIDNTISVLVFTTLIYNSSSVCFSFYVMLEPNNFADP